MCNGGVVLPPHARPGLKNGGLGGEWYHLFPESGVAPPVTCVGRTKRQTEESYYYY